MNKYLLSLVLIVACYKCTRAQQAIGILDINNIRCNVSSTGDLFNRFDVDSLPGFEAPANGGVRSIYAANLWIGGKSQDQTLKIAAEEYQLDGQDWFNGPLSDDGLAAVSFETQLQYNHVWVANRMDVETHIQYFEALQTGNASILFPDGYTTPEWMNEWPAHGNTALSQDFYLAPFYDYNQNGFYDPIEGDFPVFCGDKCVYFIFNDKGNVHSESQGLPIGLEVHGMLYGFIPNGDAMLDNTVFLKYKLINRGTQTLTECYAALWADLDIGNSNDDYVGTNVLRSTVYAYNSDNMDEPSSTSDGYGEDLAMQGLVIFGGPFQDADSLDNPVASNSMDALNALGVPYNDFGIGYGDGIIDNERLSLTGSMYHLGTNHPIYGEPASAQHYYNYMRQIWKNGQLLGYGGNGASGPGFIDGSNSNYVFPGLNDSLHWGTEGTAFSPWDELSNGNVPGDRKIIASMGPFTLNPGDIHLIDAAFVFAQESDDNVAGNLVETFDERLHQSRLFFNEYLEFCQGSVIALNVDNDARQADAKIYPNPASNFITIDLEGQKEKPWVQIFNATGTLVYSSLLPSGGRIDVSKFESGLYEVCYSLNSSKRISRLIKE